MNVDWKKVRKVLGQKQADYWQMRLNRMDIDEYRHDQTNQAYFEQHDITYCGTTTDLETLAGAARQDNHKVGGPESSPCES